MGYGKPKGVVMSKWERDMTVEESTYVYIVRKSFPEEKAKSITENYFRKLYSPNSYGKDCVDLKTCLKILNRKHL